MRRPSKTREQRAYDRTARALRALCKHAVRFAQLEEDDDTTAALVVADFQGAAYRYTNTLTKREQRRMAK